MARDQIPYVSGYEAIATELAEAILKIKELERKIDESRPKVEATTRELLKGVNSFQSIKYATNLPNSAYLTVTDVKAFKKLPLENEKNLRAIFASKFSKLFSVNKSPVVVGDRMNELFDLIRDAGKDPSDFFTESGNVEMNSDFKLLVDSLNLGSVQKQCANELIEECSHKMRISVK